MPAEDVSDLKDVFDAINRLCETMKTSNYREDDDAPRYVECADGLGSPGEVQVQAVELHRAENWNVLPPEDRVEDGSGQVFEERKEWPDRASQFVSAEDLSVQRMETQRRKWMDSQASLASSEVSAQRDAQPEERWSDTHTSPPSSDVSAARESSRERWSDCQVSPPGPAEDAEVVTSDTELAAAACEPTSDLYYTASSEVSLLSDTELADKPPTERDISYLEKDSLDREDGKEGVTAGHVAAMRERFESMTRANTPCADAARAASPALDVFRTVTPSPDLLG